MKSFEELDPLSIPLAPAKKKPIETPEVIYDLQNLPFDPAEAFRQEVRRIHEK